MRDILHTLFWHSAGRAIHGLSYGGAAILALVIGGAILWTSRK